MLVYLCSAIELYACQLNYLIFNIFEHIFEHNKKVFKWEKMFKNIDQDM